MDEAGWIHNDDGGKVGIFPCPAHEGHAIVAAKGELRFAIDNTGRDIPDMREASICLSVKDLRHLAAAASGVASALEAGAFGGDDG